MNCPLCNCLTEKSFVANGKNYYRCDNCGLVYMDENDRLCADDEKKRYSFHQNSIDDDGYVSFLGRVIEPTMKYLSAGAKGLDYGCGPNPVLAQIIKGKGFECDFYDPYFFPQCNFSAKYDFIFATECFEHFFNPSHELDKICTLLNNNGILGIMTEFLPQNTDFTDWYYKNDPTHVCFYNEKSIGYICSKYNFKELYNDKHRVIILKKL